MEKSSQGISVVSEVLEVIQWNPSLSVLQEWWIPLETARTHLHTAGMRGLVSLYLCQHLLLTSLQLVSWWLQSEILFLIYVSLITGEVKRFSCFLVVSLWIAYLDSLHIYLVLLWKLVGSCPGCHCSDIIQSVTHHIIVLNIWCVGPFNLKLSLSSRQSS